MIAISWSVVCECDITYPFSLTLGSILVLLCVLCVLCLIVYLFVFYIFANISCAEGFSSIVV